MRRLHWGTLTVLFISLAVITHMFLRNVVDPLNGLLPELIGFCLEGILFVILFTYFERRQEIRSIVKTKSNTKDTLLYVLDGLRGSARSAVSIKHKNYDIDDLVNMIDGGISEKLIPLLDDAKVTLRPVEWKRLQKQTKETLPMLQSLMPVVAQLGGYHLTLWQHIIEALQIIASTTDGNRKATTDTCPFSVIHFLWNIKEFRVWQIDPERT